MEQLPLFSQPTITMHLETRPGGRRGITVFLLTVYDEHDFPIIFIEGTHKNARGLKPKFYDMARWMLVMNRIRPLGDEFNTDLGRCSYLTEA